MKILDRVKNEEVEWKRLGEVCDIKTGKLNTNVMVENGKYPFFTCNKEPYKIDTYAFDTEAILLSGNGSQIGHVNIYSGKFNAYQRTYVIDNFKNINIKYVYYYFKYDIRKYINKNIVKGSIPYITLPVLKEYEIPIPSMETQEKIVKILDKFQKYASELQHELQHELQNRTKQYEYYRDYLLSEKYLLKKENKIEKFKLSDLVTYGKEKISFNLLNEDNYVGVDNLLKDKMGKEKSQYVPEAGVYTKYNENDILIGNIRPYLRKIWISNQNGGASGDVLVIKIKENYVEKINPKYLYYILSSEDFFEYSTRYSRGGKMPRGDKEKIMEYEIKIPTIKVQSKIVEMLDKIEKIVNNLKEGLPKEIELRQKQYEYYREQLLNFKK